MRLVFAGTPEFAAAALAALHETGHEIALVLSQPDRPKGRGLHAAPCAVKALAASYGLSIFQPASLKEQEALQRIDSVRPDAIVVAAYGLILPQAVLDAARYGAINIHASLLPRWRGAAPVQRAILAGDSVTGISIMQMDAGLDTGAVLIREELLIEDKDTTGTLLSRLADCGSRLIVRVLDQIERGAAQPVPQSSEGVTYAAKIEKSEARIDWDESAKSLWRKVRAFNPAPGAAARLKGVDLKIWQASPCAGAGRPGEVLAVNSDGIVVACGTGALRLIELQRAGGRRLAAMEFARGMALAPGEGFEIAAR